MSCSMLRSAPLAGLALAFAACGANVFPVEVKGETTIQGDPSPLPGLLSLPAIGGFTNIDFDQSQEFQNQGVTKDQVSKVTPTFVRLRIVSPNTQDFSFLESLQFYSRASDEEILVAEKFDIGSLGLQPPNPTLNLDVNPSADLVEHVTAPSMSIVVRGSGKLPPQDTTIEAVVGLDVEVKVL